MEPHLSRHTFPLRAAAFFARIFNFICEPLLVFMLMPAMMVVLVIGTIAQREMGLYGAYHTYLASLYFWLGPVPLPGGLLLIGILGLGLLCKFVLKSEWSWRKSGINLAHLGALVLLLGGLVTSVWSHESYMVIPQGQSTSYTHDYDRREMLVFKDDALVFSIDSGLLVAGRKISLGTSGMTLRVLDFCANCAIKRRAEIDQDTHGLPVLALAQFMALEGKTPEKEREANLSGLSFILETGSHDSDGFYIAFEAMPKPIEIKRPDGLYKIIYGKKQTQLPFSLHLSKFERQDHQGTAMARAYRSEVIVEDGQSRWPAVIEMNAPLRYRGYTFYQSSFDESEDGVATVLSVVRNRGVLLPYIGTLILGGGLILHWLIILRTGRRKKESV